MDNYVINCTVVNVHKINLVPRTNSLCVRCVFGVVIIRVRASETVPESIIAFWVFSRNTSWGLARLLGLVGMLYSHTVYCIIP